MADESPAAPPVSLFYSYAHEDEALRDELRGHLKILERRGLLSSWHDREIKPGEDWHAKIDAQLQMADLVLLLVSKDFIESDYIFGNELTVAMQRHKAGVATVVPILVRAIDIEAEDREALPFLELQGLPTDMRPVTSWSNRDEAWTNVAKGLRATVKVIHEKKAAAATRSPRRGGMRAPLPAAPAATPMESAADVARDPVLAEVVDGFTARVSAANLQRGGGAVDADTLRTQAIQLIDEPEWKRVLWVDDHPDHNESETSALAKLQIEVQTAKSTSEAIKVLQADPNFHLVISDWGRAWEWQAGLNLLGKVRELRASLPVVFNHGEMEPSARAARAERLRAAGAFGEAVYPAELISLVLKALSQHAPV
jgi:CheY-like chemotaxis protein